MIGIYKIENKINGKIYIGQSVNIKKRWKHHKYDLDNNKHANKHLQSAWFKYGKNNFSFSIICECKISELDEKEMYYINKNKSYDENYGYNLTIGGDGAKKFYDFDLILNTYNQNKSVVKTSELLNISEGKISEILAELNVRDIKSPNRKIIGIDCNDYSFQYEFDSIKEAYDYFNSTITNQINKSIKDSKYTAFNCIWFDREDYIKYNGNINKLLQITKYKETEKYDISKADDITHTHKTSVICITTGKIFPSVLEAARYYGIKSENGICYCCSYKRKTCGGLSWMYLDEYKYMLDNNFTIEEMKNKYIPKNTTKKVICLNYGKMFNRIVDANIYANLNIYSGKISDACQGKIPTAGRDKDGNRLYWMYYEDYISKTPDEINQIVCNIKKYNKHDNKFVCLNTGEIFDNINLVMQYTQLKSKSNIYDCCSGKNNSAGKHPITKEPLKWMYYDDYKKKYLKESAS